ncbi:hypothetical protein E2C01_048741 [Portunus trituberculatus]|uniref:Uncharacterized protein n=1 Tax=Portunus trituberculatus TaxID=210409 RepID=A0A5B7GBX4_PORTR|nr:hypothetical protein [Portunus trituberculatus]
MIELAKSRREQRRGYCQLPQTAVHREPSTGRHSAGRDVGEVKVVVGFDSKGETVKGETEGAVGPSEGL